MDGWVPASRLTVPRLASSSKQSWKWRETIGFKQAYILVWHMTTKAGLAHSIIKSFRPEDQIIMAGKAPRIHITVPGNP